MANHRWLIASEFAFVITAWTCMLIVPLYFVGSVRESLPDIWRDTSLELQFIASSMSVFFEMYVQRFHQDLLQGIGFSEGDARNRSRRYLSDMALYGWFVSYNQKHRKTYPFARHWLCHVVLKSIYERINLLMNPRPDIPRRLTAPDTNLPPYKYKPLSNSRCIRVITLATPSSSSPNAPITCTITEMDLHNTLPYTALSYAWDSDHGTEKIICDGATITVTKNCVAALRSMRDSDAHCKQRHSRIWVDAICINQGDDENARTEKSRQIGIMGEIYSKASQVRVWLGEHDRSSMVVCEYLEKVSGVFMKRRREYGVEKALAAAEGAGLDTARRWPRLSRSLADFFRRSWFHRAWPVQEVTLPLPGRVVVVCGGTVLRFEHLRFGWGILRKLGVLPPSASLDQAVALQFYLADAIALKRRLAPGEYPDFGQPLLTDLAQFSFTRVMDAMRLKACREPKDRFFALYGVFKELGIAHGIPLGMWRRSDPDVFRAVAMACFKLDGNLDALRLAQLSDPYSRLTESFLPTTRRNPYDGVSTTLFCMTNRVLKVAGNIRARRGALYVPTTRLSLGLPSWAPDWTQAVTARIDPAHHIGLLEGSPQGTSQSDTDQPGMSQLDTSESNPDQLETTLPAITPPTTTPLIPSPPASGEPSPYKIDGRHLTVRIKPLGQLTFTATVESLPLLPQLLTNSLTTLTGSRNPSHPDPSLAALSETITNYLWRSHIAQILVSLRMAFRTLHLFDIWAYGTAAWFSGYTHGRVTEQLCKRFPSVASCPADGYRMRQWSTEKVQVISETSAISQGLGVLIMGKTDMNSDMWHQMSGDVVFTLGRVLWDFRVSIVETLFWGRKFEEVSGMVVVAVMGQLIAAAVQSVATLIGDTSLFLVGWAVGALASIVSVVAVAAWGRDVLIGVAVVLALRACRNPKQLLRDLFGIARYRPAGAYTPGLRFFVTDTGITGSTSGPVTSEDVLAMIRGSSEYLVLRPYGDDGYKVVGAAYVGARPKAEELASGKSWTEVRIS